MQFLEKNIFSYTYQSFRKEQDEIHICEAKNLRKEVVYVAGEIYRLVSEEHYRYGDIAVITGDIPLYEDYLTSELSHMGIRYFIDHKRNIGANIFSEFILSLLEMLRKNFDYESTMRFLRGGLSPLTAEETDSMENYVLAFGIRGWKSYQKEWKTPYRKRKKADMEQINRSREKFISSVREVKKRFRGGKKTIGDYVRILYDYIVKEEIYHKLKQKERQFENEGQTLLAKEYHSVYQVMMELFDEMTELLGEELISAEEFPKLLGAGISEGLIGFIPPAIDQIIIGDIERTRLKDIKALFLMGVNDGLIPKGEQAPGILSQRERHIFREKNITLAPTAREQIFISQFYMYLNLTKASQKLYLSYFRMDPEGKASRPSYLLRKIRRMFPEIQTAAYDESGMDIQEILGTDRGKRYMLTGLAEKDYDNRPDIWRELFRYYKEREPEKMADIYLPGLLPAENHTKLSRKAADLLYGEVLLGNISRLERFGQCPFSHFIGYGLELEERREYRIGKPDFGNLFHDALESFSENLNRNKKKWRDLSDKEMETLAEQCVNQAAEHYKDSMFMQSERTRYIVKRIHRIMKRTIQTIASQMRDGKFEQTSYEISFSRLGSENTGYLSLADDKRMDLAGRIDRIDTYEKEDKIFVRVIDYKTGKKEFEITSMYHGLQMQLVLYLEAALGIERKSGKKTVPAGMFYYRISDPVILAEPTVSKEEIDAKIGKELSLNGFINNDEEVLLSTGNCYSSGKKGMGSEEDIYKIISHTRNKMKEFGDQIFRGSKEITPMKIKGNTYCGYCGYADICGFDPKQPEYRYQEPELLSAEEIMEKLTQEMKEPEEIMEKPVQEMKEPEKEG